MANMFVIVYQQYCSETLNVTSTVLYFCVF